MRLFVLVKPADKDMLGAKHMDVWRENAEGPCIENQVAMRSNQITRHASQSACRSDGRLDGQVLATVLHHI